MIDSTTPLFWWYFTIKSSAKQRKFRFVEKLSQGSSLLISLYFPSCFCPLERTLFITMDELPQFSPL